MIDAAAATLSLILLHAVDGREVFLNVNQIISFAKSGKQLTDKVECVITLADAKFITVRETCEQVRQLMEKAK